MAKHFNAPKAIYIGPCDDGTILYNGSDFESTLARAFLTREDALKYAESLGWPTHCDEGEGVIIKVPIDCL